MAEVVFPGPRNCTSPAVLRWFRNDLIIDLKWKVVLTLERLECLSDGFINNRHVGMRESVRTVFMAGSFATFGSVKTPTLRAFMFFRSMPTSAVTPSPKRRFDAATYQEMYVRRR